MLSSGINIDGECIRGAAKSGASWVSTEGSLSESASDDAPSRRTRSIGWKGPPVCAIYRYSCSWKATHFAAFVEKRQRSPKFPVAAKFYHRFNGRSARDVGHQYGPSSACACLHVAAKGRMLAAVIQNQALR